MWGFAKKYEGLNWFENHMGGHLNIGKFTFYGENAMHWGVTFHTNRWGYICFRLPLRCFGKWYPLYLYVSPNATPWACTFYIGPSKREKALSKLRKESLGHNFRSHNDIVYAELKRINDSL